MSANENLAGTIGRRGLLLATGAATLAAPSVSRAQGEPVKLGIVYPKQGTFAQLGEGAANAAALTLEMAGNRILGRPAQTIWLDEPNPQSAQQNMQKLIDEEKVPAVLGGASGATALALSALAKRAKMPLLTISGAAVLTGRDCNRYTFRANAPAPVAVDAIAPAMLERGKRWYFLIPDYAYGADVYAAFKAILDRNGGTQVGLDRMPLGTTDFSGFILKIRQARPDVIASALSGNELPTFLKQYAEFGMRNGAPVVSPIITDTDIVAAGPTASGMYGKVWHHSDPNNSAEDRAFTEAYRRKHGVPPHSNALLAAVCMRLLLAAVQQSGSLEAGAIVRGLETVRLQDGAYPLHFREWDHQLMRRILVLRVRPQVTDLWDALEIVRQMPDSPGGLEALYGSRAESACTIGDL